MLYAWLADLVAVVHLAFVAFAVLGGLLVLRWSWMAWLHLPAVSWGAGIELAGGICPLTPLENWLRAHAGGDVYSGGFIEHYLLPLLYPPGLTRSVQLVLALLLIACNAAVYLLVFWRRRRPGEES